MPAEMTPKDTAHTKVHIQEAESMRHSAGNAKVMTLSELLRSVRQFLTALYIHGHVYSSQRSLGGGVTIIRISNLPMWKLSHRVVKQLTQGHPVRKKHPHPHIKRPSGNPC